MTINKNKMQTILVVDNLSPFTSDIVTCLGKLGANYVAIKGNRLDLPDDSGNNFSYDRVILSGRRKNDREINFVNSRIIRQCFKYNIPLLGICYGAEILALTLGGTIRKMTRPVQDTIAITVSKSNSLLSVIRVDKTLFVYESHRYCVAKLPEGFESLAFSSECEHEVFSHKEKKMFGTQFHPEKSGADGMNIFLKFLTI
ncbi:MAG: gamma-glutamyl-gamma-aminobutyrate hydrolase family protein [Candidatus Nitrosopolaris sp.]